MIQTRREDPPPSQTEIDRRRLEQLEKRMDDFEAGQALSWAFAASSRGEDLERRVGHLAEAVRVIADLIDAGADLIDDSPSRTEAASGLRGLKERLDALTEDLDGLTGTVGEMAPLAVVENLARIIGAPGVPENGSIEDWVFELAETPARP